MKIGDRVWVRTGLDRRPIQGTLMSIDLATESGEVWLHGRKVTRALKHIDAERPKSQRDKRPEIVVPTIFRPQ